MPVTISKDETIKTILTPKSNPFQSKLFIVVIAPSNPPVPLVTKIINRLLPSDLNSSILDVALKYFHSNAIISNLYIAFTRQQVEML
jgi:hypothetical protein